MKTLKIENHSTLVLLDDEDFERISSVKWWVDRQISPTIGRTIHNPKDIIIKCPNGLVLTKRKNFAKRIPIANEVLKQYGIMLDHIDRNSFNNQKNNLRICTVKENNCNKIKCRGSTSKYKGVYRTNNKRWAARVQINKKIFNLGYFDTENEAALAYNIKAEEIHKEFVVLNIIQ